MRKVDYDVQQHQNYVRGRALNPTQLGVWMETFAALLPDRRPLDGLDLGSGTGRFTPALAEAFGPVTGVEPSAAMRRIAEDEAPTRPGLAYLDGGAEAIPLAGASVDYALMFLVWHHVRDKARAAGELARVVRPGGRLLLRAQFSDRMPRPWWLEYFPRGYEADAAMYETVAESVAWFTGAGWRRDEFVEVLEPATRTRAEALEVLRLRPYSTFEQLTEEEIATGFERLERAVAQDPDSAPPRHPATLLTFIRP